MNWRTKFIQWFSRTGQYWILAVFTLVTMLSYRGRWMAQMSPIDEATYLDIIFKFPDDLVAQRGEFFSPEIREKFACDGNHLFGKAGPPCGADYSNPKDFPQGGKTSADAYSPVFFWIAGTFARVAQLVGIDLTYGARLAMIIFGIATVLLTYKAMRMIRVPIGVAYTVLTIATMSPLFWWTYGFLSTDAPVPMFGALTIIIMIGFLQGKHSLWRLAPVAILGMLFKITTILAIGWAGLVAMLYAVAVKLPQGAIPGMETSRQVTTKQWLRPLIGATAGGVATFVAWEIIRRLIAVGNAGEQGLHLGRTSISEAIFQVQNVLRSLIDADHGESSATPLAFLISRLISFLVIAGVIGMMLYQPKSRMEFSLTWATGIASVLFLPILFVILRFGVVGFSLPPRYAIAVLPAMLLSVALSIRWVGARWLIGVITALAWVYFVTSGMTYIPQ
ncbi:hypothetical protein [Trueperella pecoris]|nr:hypothetical protein [Trueperella pecoris]QOQ39157.1 hypothetical protein HLG82_06665 [Trueperella pecoris]QTG76037.1 hypothetical protein J4179_03025 [Trueperella pecoris]